MEIDSGDIELSGDNNYSGRSIHNIDDSNNSDILISEISSSVVKRNDDDDDNDKFQLSNEQQQDEEDKQIKYGIYNDNNDEMTINHHQHAGVDQQEEQHNNLFDNDIESQIKSYSSREDRSFDNDIYPPSYSSALPLSNSGYQALSPIPTTPVTTETRNLITIVSKQPFNGFSPTATTTVENQLIFDTPIQMNSVRLIVRKNELFKCRFLLSKLSKPFQDHDDIQANLQLIVHFLLENKDIHFMRENRLLVSKRTHTKNSIANKFIIENHFGNSIYISPKKYTFIIQIL